MQIVEWREAEKAMRYGLTDKKLGSPASSNIIHEPFSLAKTLEMKHVACDPYRGPSTVDCVGVQLTNLDTL